MLQTFPLIFVPDQEIIDTCGVAQLYGNKIQAILAWLEFFQFRLIPMMGSFHHSTGTGFIAGCRQKMSMIGHQGKEMGLKNKSASIFGHAAI